MYKIHCLLFILLIYSDSVYSQNLSREDFQGRISKTIAAYNSAHQAGIILKDSLCKISECYPMWTKDMMRIVMNSVGIQDSRLRGEIVDTVEACIKNKFVVLQLYLTCLKEKLQKDTFTCSLAVKNYYPYSRDSNDFNFENNIASLTFYVERSIGDSSGGVEAKFKSAFYSSETFLDFYPNDTIDTVKYFNLIGDIPPIPVDSCFFVPYIDNSISKCIIDNIDTAVVRDTLLQKKDALLHKRNFVFNPQLFDTFYSDKERRIQKGKIRYCICFTDEFHSTAPSSSLFDSLRNSLYESCYNYWKSGRYLLLLPILLPDTAGICWRLPTLVPFAYAQFSLTCDTSNSYIWVWTKLVKYTYPDMIKYLKNSSDGEELSTLKSPNADEIHEELGRIHSHLFGNIWVEFTHKNLIIHHPLLTEAIISHFSPENQKDTVLTVPLGKGNVKFTIRQNTSDKHSIKRDIFMRCMPTNFITQDAKNNKPLFTTVTCTEAKQPTSFLYCEGGNNKWQMPDFIKDAGEFCWVKVISASVFRQDQEDYEIVLKSSTLIWLGSGWLVLYVICGVFLCWGLCKKIRWIGIFCTGLLVTFIPKNDVEWITAGIVLLVLGFVLKNSETKISRIKLIIIVFIIGFLVVGLTVLVLRGQNLETFYKWGSQLLPAVLFTIFIIGVEVLSRKTSS